MPKKSSPTAALRPPCQVEYIRRGQVYSTQQVIDILGIARPTIDGWVAKGLKKSRPGTKTHFFLGDQLILFMFEEDMK